MSVQHHAALITYVTHLPVKVKLSREESLLVHPKRHPFWMDFTIGCDENGIIQGVKAEVVSDTGAFASLGGPVLERACTHAAGPYAYENFEIRGRAFYTNNPPAGAFRGFGVTQTCFAIESLLNEMAEKIGISPWEIRYRNAIRPGGVLPNGQIVGAETGLVETLEAVKPEFDAAVKAGKPVGLACAMKNAGVGVGLPDYGRCKLIVEEDEKLHIYAGASCIGQGLGTVLVQMCVTATPLTREQIVYERSNTWIAPDSGDTSGSRQTLITGEACRRACEAFCRALEGHTMKDLNGQEFYGEYYAKTDPLGADKPNPVSHVAYGYATLPFDKIRFSQLNTASAGIVTHCCFFSARTEEMPEVIALDHVLIALHFSAKLCVFAFQIRCAEFAANGFVLRKLLLQTGNLFLEPCNQPVCRVQSFLQLGFLFLGCNVLLCKLGQMFKILTLHGNLGRKGNGLRFNLFNGCHIDLLILNFFDLFSERRCLLLLLSVLLREFCQPCLLPLHLELRHCQVFLGAAAFAALHIVVPGVAHIPEEIILQNAIGFFENRLALGAQNRRTVLVQRGLGSPFLAHADLLYRFLDRPHQRFILAAFRP